ncbi:MAG: hypothetical protein WBA89_09335 [Microcoleus sp.]|uniref:hypothetical protein n=1 Tax=Microcoleus sp. TaxID=44472 RepID=UPI003C730A15
MLSKIGGKFGCLSLGDRSGCIANALMVREFLIAEMMFFLVECCIKNAMPALEPGRLV